MYEYLIREVINVIDGDTVDLVIDLGFGLRSNIRVRVVAANGYVDTPERGDKEAWQRAKDFTTDWLQAHSPLAVATQKSGPSTKGIGDGAFGRWLGDIYSLDKEWLSLGSALIDQGWVR